MASPRIKHGIILIIERGELRLGVKVWAPTLKRQVIGASKKQQRIQQPEQATSRAVALSSPMVTH